MDELLSEFLTECCEGMATLDAELVSLERDPEDRDRIASIFRIVHTIKGTCGFLALTRLERVAHAAENVLGRLREGTLDPTPEALGAIFAAVDRVRSILDQPRGPPVGYRRRQTSCRPWEGARWQPRVWRLVSRAARRPGLPMERSDCRSSGSAAWAGGGRRRRSRSTARRWGRRDRATVDGRGRAGRTRRSAARDDWRQAAPGRRGLGWRRCRTTLPTPPSRSGASGPVPQGWRRSRAEPGIGREVRPQRRPGLPGSSATARRCRGPAEAASPGAAATAPRRRASVASGTRAGRSRPRPSKSTARTEGCADERSRSPRRSRPCYSRTSPPRGR